MDENALIQSVKRKLNITWSDAETDARVAEIIADGKAAITHKLGLPDAFDFTAPGQERNLFLAWCLYEWNHASNEFDANYLGDIIQCRNKWIVEGDANAVQAEQVQ